MAYKVVVKAVLGSRTFVEEAGGAFQADGSVWQALEAQA